MSTLARRLAVLLTIPLLLLLTSCIRMTMDVDIEGPEQIGIVADIGMQNAAAQELGANTPDFCDEAGFDGEGATSEPYADPEPEGYTGCRVTGTTTVSDMGGEGVRLTLVDDVWTFSMEGAAADSGDQLSATMFTDFRVSVTFPGEVLTHNGSSTVDGTTVTWSKAADLFSREGLEATAEGSGSIVGSNLTWIVLALVALGAVGAVAFFLVRRKKAPPAAPPYQQYPGGPPYQDAAQHYGPGQQAPQPYPQGPQPYPQPGPRPYPPAPQPQPQPGPRAHPQAPQHPQVQGHPGTQPHQSGLPQQSDPQGPYIRPDQPLYQPGTVQPGQEPHQPGFEPPRSE